MIPDEVISEVKKRTDIGAVIGRTVKLKRTGRNLVGLCPFHNEKSPSFSVNPSEGFFYCFGCRAAGDVVEFVVKSTGRGFLDVVTELAQEAGVPLPDTRLSPAEAARAAERKALLRVLELSQVYFATALKKDEGKAARAYLRDVRKLEDDTIDRFGLGFGGGGDAGLRDFLVSHGCSSEEGIRAGVLARSRFDDESAGASTAPVRAYDFYKNRITIPIRGTRGEVVGFGGRAFLTPPPGRTVPKYVNGPQTPVYDKSSVLYGLFEALPGLKQGKPAVLVEGYLDVIACHRAGLPTAVAPCGTSLTPRHVGELVKRAGKVVVCLDADKAGQAAALAAVLMLLRADVETAVVTLPAKDPDALVGEGRAAELLALLQGAPSALDAAIAKAREKATGSVQARMKAIDALLPVLAAPPRELVRQGACAAAALALGEDKDVLFREVEGRGRQALGKLLRGGAEGASSSSSSAPSSSVASGARAAPPRGGGQGQPAQAGRGLRAAAGERGERGERGQGSDRQPPAPLAPARRAAVTFPPYNEAEVQLARVVLCQPHLAPRVQVLLGGPGLANPDLSRFVRDLVAALVRFHDLPPREALKHVGVHPRSPLVALADRVQREGPERVLGEATALAMVEDFSRDILEVQGLKQRLATLQSALAGADERDDRTESRQLLAEQARVVAETIALLEQPAGRPSRSAPALALPATSAPPRAALPVATHPDPAPAANTADAAGPAGPDPAARPPLALVPVPSPVPHPVPHPAVEPDDVEDPPWAADPDDDPWAV